ncbi:FecR family protein [Pedobacter sp. Du54]|uniref:FecR family protein n=1 Tax=Pedobacter anseongensis TaxID=3133439 RepID=UPI0030AAB130
MNSEEAEQLLLKYNLGKCTPSEKALLEDWLLQYNEHDIDISSTRIEELGKKIYAELPIHKKKVIKLWASVISAAAMLVIAFGIWHFHRNSQLKETSKYVHDISPGGNKATLTLADGRSINLNTAKSGVSIRGNTVSYLDGKIIDHEDKSGGEAMQVLTTPKGGQYHLILSDGTKIWLNAASSIKYPVSFIGKNERRVILTGEAYFEVTKVKGAKMPFIVVTGAKESGGNGQEVEVLGTHFNINTYNVSQIKTTLLEGSVRVSASNVQGAVLKPGDQSTFSNHQFAINKVDTDLEIAWKNGKTAFESADIQSVMQMLTLWYDIKVIYSGEIPKVRFSGAVSRSKNISEVLKLLESTNDVHFKIEGREITVMN